MSDIRKKYEWPDCEPDSDGCISLGFSDGYNQYEKVEVEPGRWQWVINEDAMKRMRDDEDRRLDLWWALRSRVLTDEEMEQVRRRGSFLNTPSGQSYNGAEKAKELSDALYNQARLRLIDARLRAGDDPEKIPELK